MARACAGAFVILIVFAAVAAAGIPDPDNSRVELTKTDPDGMATCPSLDGLPYQYIKVIAQRADFTPIQGVPSTSFFFTVTGGDINLTAVDAETDVNGEIRFQADDNESLALGSVTIDCQIYTVVLNDSDVLEVNTFDLNGDGSVGGGDFTLFVGDYGDVPVQKRSDFNWDGAVAGGDFTLFVGHYGD